jgi:uncharacterized membrane protein
MSTGHRPPRFPPPYRHDHPPVVDVTTQAHEQRTTGQRAADTVAAVVGSWRFIIIQSVLLTIWVIINVIGVIERWDPYPFILLNLLLSLQAAYTAPIIMMSQNREAQLDRLRAEHDFQINVKAEEEIRVVLEHLEAQSVVLQKLIDEIHANGKPSAG